MGLTDYLYHFCQAVIWAKRLTLGNWRGPSILFKWDRVVANFLKKKGYGCKHPWLYKEIKDGMIEAGIFIYVDDRRPIGPTE